MIVLRHFSLDKKTCNLYLYDVAKPVISLIPIHQGRISFTYDKGKMRPFRYEEKRGNTFRFLKAKDVINLVSAAETVVFLNNERPSNLSEYLEFVKFAGNKTPKVLEVCELCLRDDNGLTRIKKENTYYVYGKNTCRSCASQTIQSEYTKRGIPITISARKFYHTKLDRLKEVSQVIETIWESSLPSHSLDSTLFDVISADKDSKPISMKHYFDKNKRKLRYDPELLSHYQSIGIKKLMPVQVKSIENGLLNKEDLLIVAGTSSGKTLVGELAGINNWKTRNEVFLYVSPLVALTNQKFDSFKKRYRKLGARVAIRVGKSRVMDQEEKGKYTDGNFSKADIIVATYEAMDWLFRSGSWKKLPNIGTLVVDEFQLLADQERGAQVDGLIARVKSLYPNCQIIGLSATIGNEEELAKQFGLKLVSYMNRPIPLERHLVISEGEEKKIDILENYVIGESKIRSSTGHRGQSLIFTNTRRRVQEIGNSLKGVGIRSGYYHAGMTYMQRRKTEKQFENGELDVLTTTAALGAGADFPVSQVIFERPAMGNRWISIAEYHQMAGRAGRFGYHDLGKAIMIASVGEKIYKAQDKSEEQVAFDILTGTVEDIEGEVQYENELDQILAFISAAYPLTESNLQQYYKKLYFRTDQLKNIVKSLKGYGLIAMKENRWYITPLGRAISESFLKPSLGYDIALQTSKKSIEEIAVEMASIESVYVTSRMQSKLEQATKGYLSSRFFSDAILETISDLSTAKGRISSLLLDQIRFWQRSFFDCTCKINPYCEHPKYKVSKMILELRMQGMSVKQITNHLSKHYDLMIYQGDLMNWLDEIIHAVNAIGRLAKAMKMDKIEKATQVYSLNIEAPEINFDLTTLPKLKSRNYSREKNKKPRKLQRKLKKQHRGKTQKNAK